MSPTPTFDSAASMVAALPSDLFSGVDAPDTGADTTVDTDTPDEGGSEGADIQAMDDSPDDETPVGDEASDEAPAAATDGDEEAPAVAAKPEDEEVLPDGVTRGKDRKGKPGLFLTEQRYETFHGNHKLAQEAAQVLGEPLTIDGIKLRNDAFLGSERLWTNLTSGDPAAQGDVIDTILSEMRGARDAGETAVDPSVPFAETFYDKIRDSSPDAYAQIRLMAARELMQEMYELAAETGNDGLKLSMRHLAAGVVNAGPKPAGMTPEDYVQSVRAKAESAKLPFYDDEQVPKLVRPALTAEQQELAELRADRAARQQTSNANPAAQYGPWRDGNIKEVNTAVFDDAIKPALAAVEGSWKDFPDDYKRLVVNPLHSEVARIVKADTGLSQRVAELQARAKRATSEQVRADIGNQIKQLYVSRAKLAAEGAKAPIIEFAGKSLKGRSDANHDRRNGAQARTAPKGQSAPVRKSALPDLPQFKNNEFDPKIAAQQAARLMAALNV